MFSRVNHTTLRKNSALAESGQLLVVSPVVVEDHGRLVSNRDRWRMEGLWGFSGPYFTCRNQSRAVGAECTLVLPGIRTHRPAEGALPRWVPP